MLHAILDAHGGALPPDVVVTFANTGKEREETLRFVYECGERWNVKIHWLEWREAGGFEEIGYNSASRNGEPFSSLVAKKKYLPNSVTRFCTQELKIRVMRDFCRSIGWKNWTNVIGLRYDEGRRVMSALERNDAGKDPWVCSMPLSSAKVTKRDVKTFWLGPSMRIGNELPQGFDLGLEDYEGNCDLCFLKGRKVIEHLMRSNPGMGDWWIEREATVGASRPSGERFATEYSYSDMFRFAQSQADLFDGSADEYDVECGLACAVE